MHQVLLCSSLLAVSMALPAGPPAYGAPAPYVEEKLPPQPYAYEYGVADDYSKANFKKTETQDAGGNVIGSFTIALPDGRIQTTTYTGDQRGHGWAPGNWGLVCLLPHQSPLQSPSSFLF